MSLLNDVRVSDPPSDAISSLSLNGDTDTPSSLLIAGSWDNTVRSYELQYDHLGNINNAVSRQVLHCDDVVLSTDIASDGVTALIGTADNKVMWWNPTEGTAAQRIGEHDAPVSAVKYSTELGLVISSSWDRSVRVWDTRQSKPVHTVHLSSKVHCMDVRGPAMVVGTADRMLHVYELSAGAIFASNKSYQSPLNYQTRCVSIFSDVSGFAVGGIEGRVAIEYFAELGNKERGSENFIFKCHRGKLKRKLCDVYPVNAISFNHLNTFATAGSDGVINYWDKDKKKKLLEFDRFKKDLPITCCTFSPSSNILAYSLSYDWSLGPGHDEATNHILIHQNTLEEISSKK